jgi:hypothetical protein
MKSNHLQSLSRRVKNALSGIHTEIRFEADTLTGNEDTDRPVYGTLSRLQRERKKLEVLSKALKADLKAQASLEAAEKAVRKLRRQERFRNLVLIVTDGEPE